MLSMLFCGERSSELRVAKPSPNQRLKLAARVGY